MNLKNIILLFGAQISVSCCDSFIKFCCCCCFKNPSNAELLDKIVQEFSMHPQPLDAASAPSAIEEMNQKSDRLNTLIGSGINEGNISEVIGLSVKLVELDVDLLSTSLTTENQSKIAQNTNNITKLHPDIKEKIKEYIDYGIIVRIVSDEEWVNLKQLKDKINFKKISEIKAPAQEAQRQNPEIFSSLVKAVVVFRSIKNKDSTFERSYIGYSQILAAIIEDNPQLQQELYISIRQAFKMAYIALRKRKGLSSVEPEERLLKEESNEIAFALIQLKIGMNPELQINETTLIAEYSDLLRNWRRSWEEINEILGEFKPLFQEALSNMSKTREIYQLEASN